MADLIITGDYLVTQNEAGEVIRDGAVAVTGARITAVGPADLVLAEHGRGARIMPGKHCLVMPGLINTHTHVSMTCLRGLADDLPLMAWLNENIFPAEQKLTAEMVYWGALLGCAEMIASGTTCFLDMYLFEQEVARAVDRSGLRAVVGEVLYDFPSPNYGPIEEGLKFTGRLIDEWRGHSRVQIAVEPHAPYTCSPEVLKACRDLAAAKNALLHIHLAETWEEVKGIQDIYGLSPVRHLDYLGLLAPNLVAAHCVALNGEDIETLAGRGVKVAHNPNSNMKLASGIAPVPEMIKAGVTVGLGTDGPASNNTLDMFKEMNTAAKLQKIAQKDPAVMNAQVVLDMSTAGGARVLSLEKELGRLVPGFLADLIVVDLNQPHLTPLYHPNSHLVYAARGADVIHTMVHGQLLMENRRLLSLDMDEIYSQMARISGIMRKVING